MKIKWKLNVLMSIAHYKKLRQCNMTGFIEKTNKHFNTKELTEEHLDVKIVRDKGYAEMYHNGCKVNYDNGFRRTVGNMASYQRRVWIFGPCIVLGSYVSDVNTIPSIIQKELGDSFLVLNRGQPNAYGLNLLMRSIEFYSDDIVLYIEREGGGVSYDYDMIDSYRKVRKLSKHVSDSLMHCDSVVTNQVALDLVDLIRKKMTDVFNIEAIRFGGKLKRAPEIDMIKNNDFVIYLNQIRPSYKSGLNGAIVMNCNPFTKGHLYLIKEASKRVDNLYIFVVEENKSFFPFEDRYALVKSGTSHLSNVQVLKSGKFAISSTTLPGYFEKDQLGDVYLDASSDLELFLQIAKVLDISIRFAGHEPMDKFTAQYNLNMGKYLTRYGIEFCEIERVKDENEYISASRVRRLLKEDKLAEIKQLVPDCTYEYLKNRKEK